MTASDNDFRRPPLRPGTSARAVQPRASGPRHPRRRSGRPSGPARPSAKKPGGRRIARWLLSGVLAAVLVLAAVAGIVYAQVTSTLPDTGKQLRGSDQTTKVYDRSGKLIADLFAEQNRTSVALGDIPPSLRQAVIATEDERYYRHAGVDPLGILRALYTDLTAGKAVQGGSTITQQYVKNAFVTDERSARRKMAEALLAYRVEKRYSKDKILEMYLNTIYFGHGAYGVERAAEVYFGKPVSKLGVAESAMLAGVVKSPGRYSPYLNASAAKLRRGVVLSQMRDQGYIDEASRAAADAEPIKVAGLKSRAAAAPYFLENVKTLLVEQFGAEAVYRGGLTVSTTLDLSMQRAAEAAVRETLDREGDPSAALVAIDPANGEIRALVGGRDFATQQFNVAVQGHRQPGSAFKPFVLVAALTDKVSPEQTFESGAVELSTGGGGPVWRVTGAGGERSGPMRLREATARSVNSVFAQLVLQVGAQKTADTAKAIGITTPVMPVPAIALGGLAEGVSPLEMASAYATLAQGGVRFAPRSILQVKDQKGAVLFKAKAKGEAAIDPAVAYLATDMLKGVITEGTGKAAGIGRPAAGKTGTTQAYRDAWFCGYTPQLATAVWVGYPDSQKEMTSVHGRKVTGGSFPAEIWQRFMEAALQGTRARDFTRPERGLEATAVCMDTGLAATEVCPHKAAGLFLSGALPKPCTTHVPPVRVTLPSVVGLTRQAASETLQKLGLTVTVVARPVAGVSPGVVASQEPTAGVRVEPKSSVTLVVSAPAAVSSPGAPVAAFTFVPDKPKAGKPVTFDASASQGDALTFSWTFGDGTVCSAGKTASHTYDTKSDRVVVLTVTDRAGRTATVSHTIAVR